MWSFGRGVLQDLLRQVAAVRSFSLSPAQHTVIVERMWEVPLSKLGRAPKLHPRRHRIYRLVEDLKRAPRVELELILTQPVKKLGERGDTVFVKKSFGRNKLLPQGLAVYASPENRQMFAEERRKMREGSPEERVQTRTAQMTVKYLTRYKLEITKTSDEFQLTKAVVCRQFDKKLGLVVPLHALNLPFEPIKELGEHWCEITVNGLDTVRIPMWLLPNEGVSASSQEEAEAASEASVEETTSGDTQTRHDSTAPPSEGPEKN
uniref:Large ribosomal subunit protein bL9m n=1 Tax=Austrofundulus limnaeus TaxID=52670 RepID=A0A2I4AIC7_AUSLI